jgi:hypothetical protein
MALIAVGLVSAFFLASAGMAAYKGQASWQAGLDFALGAAIAAWALHSARRTLECDRSGLRYRGNAPWPLSALDPDWTLAWSEIRSARWESGLIPAQLVLETARGPRRISALEWQSDLEESRRCRRAFASFRLGRANWFDTSLLPLVRALREGGVDVPEDVGASIRDNASFDLAKNPATKRSLLIAAAAAAFWFIDASVSDQMYGREEPWLALGVFTGATAIAFAFAQARSAVPALANAIVTATVALALGLAFYGGLQRLNQLADREAPHIVLFTLERDGSLTSNVREVRDLPPGFFGDAAYWAAQRPGSRHRFGYHRGLGFETLDIGEYRARLKAFYGRDPGRDIVRP